MGERDQILCLFDVDGTLTLPRKKIEQDTLSFLMEKIKPKYKIALVGGSDLCKISEQMGGSKVLDEFDYVFSENGLIAHQHGKEISRQTLLNHVGEETVQKFINFALGYMSKITLPVKRGNFIEFRSGLINVCPVGRSCSQAERDQFDAYDKVHNIRANFVEALKKEFPEGLKFSIGGQISIDVFPIGWDKTYCLKHLEKHNFKEIHFFGDKTDPGGNDHEIYEDKRTIGHKVTSPSDTMKQLQQLLSS